MWASRHARILVRSGLHIASLTVRSSVLFVPAAIGSSPGFFCGLAIVRPFYAFSTGLASNNERSRSGENITLWPRASRYGGGEPALVSAWWRRALRSCFSSRHRCNPRAAVGKNSAAPPIPAVSRAENIRLQRCGGSAVACLDGPTAAILCVGAMTIQQRGSPIYAAFIRRLTCYKARRWL